MFVFLSLAYFGQHEVDPVSLIHSTNLYGQFLFKKKIYVVSD